MHIRESIYIKLKISAIILLNFILIPRSSSRFLILVDENSNNWVDAFVKGVKEFEDYSGGKTFDVRRVQYVNDSNWDEVCQIISKGISGVLDLTHQLHGETKPQTFFPSKSVPYFKVDVPTDSLITGANALLESKNASNGFLIFHEDNNVGRAVHLILGNTLIRYAFLNARTMGKLIVEKFDYRIPSAVILFGTGQQFEEFIRGKYAVVRNRTEWLFMFDSFQTTPPPLNVSFPYLRGYFDVSLCCRLLSATSGSLQTEATTKAPTSCDPNDCIGDPGELYLQKLGFIASDTLNDLGGKTTALGCEANSNQKGDAAGVTAFSTKLGQKSMGLFTLEKEKMTLSSVLTFDEFYNDTAKPVGKYLSATGFEKDANYQFRKRPPYYRIGIVEFKPWTYKNNQTGEWEGYCIDLAKKIAQQMNFTFDFIESPSFGSRDNRTGRWSGLTGDLVHGKIDIAIAAYIMTSEREEYIDFVSPYYEQSGLLITMQRPVVKNSLFKFMTVLRPEVWFSIAGATIATGFMLWFLDKFSPYSAQNNPHKYKNFRKFTLKESFWFALTSFTPQGGGEPPKAFSGRTLVAAYWIFVVLMLATFTANLAAFLTVERMQSPIRNLEHLAGQSSVKYSVVNGSTAEKFFRNMANAEEILYQMWRNLTLSAPSSEKQYIVWEYPIREMYIHIQSVIDKTKYEPDYETGLQRAMEDPYYAFIHDAAQTKYEVYRNCNLTLIGEPFAESPYAIAVAQGNPLQDNISMAILELQTARFFETLSSNYWSPVCQSQAEGEGDGISLESLGGVFIATIIGLGIAFISLAFEVFSTARARRKAKIDAGNAIMKTKFVGPMDFYGTSKKSEAFRRANFLPEVMN